MEQDKASVTFTEGMVDEWCEATNTEPIGDDVFGQLVVPGMMLMDHLEPVLQSIGGEDETVILSGIIAARFRDPVLFGETVTFSTEIVEEDKRFTTVDFEARVEERDSLVANGSVSVVIK